MMTIRILIDDRHDPVALEPHTVPVLRWRVAGERPMRTYAHRVIVASGPELAAAGVGDVWDSGRVEGDAADRIPLTAVDTAPSRRYWAAVRLWREDGERPWSPVATFGTGAGTAWHGSPIWTGLPDGVGAEGNAGGWAFLRGRIELPDIPVRWATLNVTASSTRPARQFVYRLWLDGGHVGAGPVFPIGDETRYDGYDVTAAFAAGRSHAIGVIAYAMEDRRFAAQVDVGFADGSVRHYATGAAWRALPAGAVYPPSASVGTQYFDAPAEDLDLAHFPHGFSRVGFPDSNWPSAVIRPPFARLSATPSAPMTVRAVPPETVRLAEDGSLIASFPHTIVGGVRLRVGAGRPATLSVRCGEVLEPSGAVRYRLSASNVYRDRWRFPAGTHEAQHWGIRVFRHVQLVPEDRGGRDAIRALAKHPERLRAMVFEQPEVGMTGSFDCSDERVNRVWALCRTTIAALNADIYVDSWTRERAPYEADAWIQQRAHLALADAPALGAYTIDWLISNRTWPTEWPLYLILAVHDAWMHTGSTDQAREQYGRLMGLLPDRYLDAGSGLLVKSPGESSHMDGDLVDWPQAERDGFVFGRVNTVVNALASRAYADMADLAAALDRADDAVRLRRTAARMREAIHGRLYDAETGAYRDGLTDGPDGCPIGHCGLHASAFALAFADVPADRIPRVGAFLKGKGMACSVYAAAVYLDGLYRAGLGADADRLIGATEGVRTWANMMRQGAGATMEAWDPSLKPNTTYSHPWAASPAYLLPEGLLGIRPVTPGFRRFAVIPQPGGMPRADATLPVAAGDIAVSWRQGPDVAADHGLTVDTHGALPRPMALRVQVPAGCRGIVVLTPDAMGMEPLRGASGPLPLAGAPAAGVRWLDEAVRVADVWCPAGSLIVDGLDVGDHRLTVR